MNRLLLIEDDAEISEMLESYLVSQGFEIYAAFDGIQAVQMFQERAYDLILLDLMIPRLSGMEVMKKIRQTSTVSIIIMSAKDTDSDKSLGLGLGADDYITKPLSVTELLARIRANIRRSTQYAGNINENGNQTMADSGKTEAQQHVEVGDLLLDLQDFTLKRKGELITLTAREFEILKLLMSNPKKVYTKEQLFTMVWKDDYYGDENVVNVQISRLRNKIEEDPRNPRYLLTVWGIGYKIGS